MGGSCNTHGKKLIIRVHFEDLCGERSFFIVGGREVERGTGTAGTLKTSLFSSHFKAGTSPKVFYC